MLTVICEPRWGISVHIITHQFSEESTPFFMEKLTSSSDQGSKVLLSKVQA